MFIFRVSLLFPIINQLFHNLKVCNFNYVEMFRSKLIQIYSDSVTYCLCHIVLPLLCKEYGRTEPSIIMLLNIVLKGDRSLWLAVKICLRSRPTRNKEFKLGFGSPVLGMALMFSLKLRCWSR